MAARAVVATTATVAAMAVAYLCPCPIRGTSRLLVCRAHVGACVRTLKGTGDLLGPRSSWVRATMAGASLRPCPMRGTSRSLVCSPNPGDTRLRLESPFRPAHFAPCVLDLLDPRRPWWTKRPDGVRPEAPASLMLCARTGLGRRRDELDTDAQSAEGTENTNATDARSAVRRYTSVLDRRGVGCTVRCVLGMDAPTVQGSPEGAPVRWAVLIFGAVVPLVGRRPRSDARKPAFDVGAGPAVCSVVLILRSSGCCSGSLR